MEQITRKRNQWKQSLKLTKHAQSLKESQSNDQENTSLHKTSKELETALTNCNELHNKALELVDSKRAEYENEWIRNVHTLYKEVSGRIKSLIANRSRQCTKTESTSTRKSQDAIIYRRNKRLSSI